MAKSVSAFIGFILSSTGLTKLYETLKSAYNLRKSAKEIAAATDWVEAAREIKLPLGISDETRPRPWFPEAIRAKIQKFDEESVLCVLFPYVELLDGMRLRVA